jgi:hypothetical protein
MEHKKVRAKVLLDVFGDGREIAYGCGKVLHDHRIYTTSLFDSFQVSEQEASGLGGNFGNPRKMAYQIAIGPFLPFS